jgi:hypothetical protein
MRGGSCGRARQKLSARETCVKERHDGPANGSPSHVLFLSLFFSFLFLTFYLLDKSTRKMYCLAKSLGAFFSVEPVPYSFCCD